MSQQVTQQTLMSNAPLILSGVNTTILVGLIVSYIRDSASTREEIKVLTDKLSNLESRVKDLCKTSIVQEKEVDDIKSELKEAMSALTSLESLGEDINSKHKKSSRFDAEDLPNRVQPHAGNTLVSNTKYIRGREQQESPRLFPVSSARTSTLSLLEKVRLGVSKE